MARPENLKNILSRRLKHYGLDKVATAARVCAVALELSGDEFEPISFKNGALKVSVGSAARAHLLRLKEKEVVARINLKLGSDLVKKLRFEISK